MIMFLLAATLFSATLFSSNLAAIQEPPSITVGPPASLQLLSNQRGAQINLRCVASGAAPLEYEWIKDNRQIQNANQNQYTVAHTEGTETNGYYQCRVRNSRGTAVSNLTHIMEARQAVFPKEDPDIKHATLGAPLKIACRFTDAGIPKPETSDFTWKSPDGDPFTTNRRVQIDETGNLHIASVQQSDISKRLLCYINNRINTVSPGGSEIEIRDSSKPPMEPSRPSIMFYSNQSLNLGANPERTVVMAIEGQNVSIRCFFSGSDDIRIEWLRHGYQPPPDRMSSPNSGSELFIKNVQDSDAGDFVCRGKNNHGQSDFSTQIVVYAVPEFKSIADKPHNVNASVSDDVTFRCNARANPPATIKWFINGMDLSLLSRPNKYRLSADRTTLTVVDACKTNCSGGSSDIMVVQCNASNTFGSAFSNGFINVFDRTVFTVEPEDAQDVIFPQPVTFYAHAESDSSTPVTYQWFFDDNLLASDDKYVIDAAGNLTITRTDDSDGGEYKCVATNGVSTVEKTVELNFIAGASIWWIVLVLLLLIFLLAAIILFICCAIYRNRGEDYLVDETERKCGNNPEKDLADADFQPFSRQDEVSTYSTGNRSNSSSTHSLINETGTETVTRRPSNFGTLK